MKAAVDESICVFGSGVILRHITALRAEINGVRQAQDIEYIHRMRVASRRLRTALPLFRACTSAKKLDAWEKDIRAITRALGAARDADVQLDLLARVTRQAAQSAYRSGLR
ncbi:MAG TPA: CHAD domain-containing protein, partial [Anaerolineaceae bacterium]